MKAPGSGIFQALAVAFALSVSALPAFAYTAGDQNWDTQFGGPGTSNNVNAIAVNGGNLYIGGFFNRTCALRMWNGLQWSTIGTFTNAPVSPDIYDLAFVGNTLYAAGAFTAVNGVPATGVAQWNGTSWTGLTLSGTIRTLAANGNDLYVGGLFTNLDSSNVVMTNIGRWDGSAWHAVGNGLGIPNISEVLTIAVNAGTVYAGGIFTNSGSQAISNLAVWNGSSWAPVGGGPNGAVTGIAFSSGNIYAAGNFTQAGSTPVNYVAMWNGTAWSALAGGLGSSPSSMAAFNGLICVAGSFASAGGIAVSNFAAWNGVSWLGEGTGLSSTGNRVVSTGTNVYVGGVFGVANGGYVSQITSWDGANWTAIGTPGRMNGVVNTINGLAADGANVYAGGAISYAGLVSVTNIARFDGSNWHPIGSVVPFPANAAPVDAIAVGSNGVYIGGAFPSVSGVGAANVARWDGTNWYGLGSGPGGVVSSITPRPDGIYATGAAYNGSVYGSPFLSRWDGANWNGVLNFNSSNTFIQFYINDPNIGMTSVAFQGSNLFVGGHFNITWHDPTLTYFTNCSNIMYFDGTYAQVVGTGLDSNVLTMSLFGSNLYVGGFFAHAGGASANKIARWDGTNWYPVGAGVVGNGTVFALAAIGNDLYAGGSFTNMGNVVTGSLAMWDGTNWHALGSGINGAIDCLAAINSDLFAGGTFRTAGVSDSLSIAHWNSQSNFDVPQLIFPFWAGPGQFESRLFGLPGLTNIVQASTNLASWTAIATNTNGVYEFIDTKALNYTHRFYRAVLGP